jgi:hypothetical protein
MPGAEINSLRNGRISVIFFKLLDNISSGFFTAMGSTQAPQ